ncbi:MAG TPA: DNA polymerase III subunit delta, partial [Paludibacteraceae bacterium]|nr:DNA polymerase III subunit delta [Paludibacteraceae bacterium]
MAKQNLIYADILRDLQQKIYYPVYFLVGEEPYYIDLISDYIQNNILTETEKDFDQTIFYGKDVDIPTVINAAKRFP